MQDRAQERMGWGWGGGCFLLTDLVAELIWHEEQLEAILQDNSEPFYIYYIYVKLDSKGSEKDCPNRLEECVQTCSSPRQNRRSDIYWI